MKKPGCGCAGVTPELFEAKVEAVALEVCEQLHASMQDSGLCHAARDYAMVTCCALIVRCFAEMTTPHDEAAYTERCNEKVDDMMKVLVAEVMGRDEELKVKMARLYAMAERDDAGGLQ